MRRLLVLNSIPSPYNDALFPHLARQPGIELRVAYCAWREANRSWQLDVDKGYPYTVLPGRSFGDPMHLNPGVVGLVRGFAPDVAVLSGSYTMPTMQLAALALEARRVPWVYWGEELALDPVSVLRRGVRAALRRRLRAARGVFAIGSRARASYERIGVPRERIADFRYYADVPRFALSSTERAAARAEMRARLAVAEDAPVFLFCGQLVGRKGVDTLLRAHARLREHVPAAVAVIAGDGPDDAALRALATSLGTADGVRFAGFVQPADLPRAFAAADAFVLPSHREGWGVVVHEAMAAGLPVLASDQVNAAVDLVREGETGWRFAAGDDATLAEQMHVLCMAADRVALGRRAQAVAAAQSPEHAARRMASLLDAAVAGRALSAL